MHKIIDKSLREEKQSSSRALRLMHVTTTIRTQKQEIKLKASLGYIASYIGSSRLARAIHEAPG